MMNIFNRVQKLLSSEISQYVFIIGAQKAGTTTLFNLLDATPGFCGAIDKEVGFFIHDFFYDRGERWYLRKFSRCDQKEIKFEATPEYLYYPDVPQKILSFNKQSKFIVVLREPSARCYSAWNMFRHFNQHSAKHIYEGFVQYANPPIKDAAKKLLFAEKFPTFQQAVLDDIERYNAKSTDLEPSFVRRGIYSEQIENYLRYYSLSDFLFLEQRELSQPDGVLKKISSFLDIEIDVLTMRKKIQSNRGKYDEIEESVSDAISFLKDFYRPYNEKLFKVIGINYDWNEK